MKRFMLATFIAMSIAGAVGAARADETCMSPYLPKITGQEDYIYVWTLGIEGVGDGSDKLVTVGANPKNAATFGKVISQTSVGGRYEAHHGDFDDDRRHFWVSGLDPASNKMWIFDVAADPEHPKLLKTIDTFAKDSGGVAGPHTFFALPGQMLITGLSNTEDKSGRTGIVEYNNAGEFVRTIWMPKDAEYGYDARVQPRLNRMLTSSFTGAANYMRDFGAMLADPEAMKHFGNTVVVWDFHARKPIQTLAVPGAPLEIRWALQPRHNYAFTTSALTAKIWLIEQKDDGTFAATAVSDIGDPKSTPLPVDISLSADDKFLFVDTFMDGSTHVYDVSDPHKPKLVHTQKIGAQVNMVSQTWDGKRLYFTSSLLANWDKKGKDDEQFLKSYTWDGSKLTPVFALDFKKEGLGRPHLMRFGQAQFYKNQIYTGGGESAAVADAR